MKETLERLEADKNQLADELRKESDNYNEVGRRREGEGEGGVKGRRRGGIIANGVIASCYFQLEIEKEELANKLVETNKQMETLRLDGENLTRSQQEIANLTEELEKKTAYSKQVSTYVELQSEILFFF